MRRLVPSGSVLFFFMLVLTILGGDPGDSALAAPPDWEVKLTAGDLPPNADFGRSVAAGGDLVAVGAGGADAGSVEAGGAVYLFKRKGLGYLPEAKLMAPDATTGAEFGRAVAIQGNLVVVGARFAQVDGFAKAGAAYIYRKAARSWYLEAKITSPFPENEDNFGRALAIHGDLLVVTARKEALNVPDGGAAYVFRHVGNTWRYEAKLTPGVLTPQAYFGQSVAVAGDLVVVGARNADPKGAGAVYLFNRSGDEWTEEAKLVPPDGNADDQFGFTVEAAGNVIAVGARRADLPGAKDAGAVYVFELTGDGVAFVSKLTAGVAKGGDQFGQSVAVTGDIIAVGANRADIGGKADQGAVHLFRRLGNEWAEVEVVTAMYGEAGDEFGYSLAAFGNLMVTGAHTANSTEGVAYVMPLHP